MSERLQLILQEIEDGTRTQLLAEKFSVSELLSKDSNGITFMEILLKKNISLGYYMNDVIKNNIDIAYLYCKYNKLLYNFKLSENDLFSSFDDKIYLEYFIQNDKLNSEMVYTITNHMEVIDILIKYNKLFFLLDLNSEIINKLITKNTDGIYLLEKYINDDAAMKIIISKINDLEFLLEICEKYNKYDLLKNVNENVLMSKMENGNSLLFYLINEKNIIPVKLKYIPNKIEYVMFLYNNKLFDYLVDAPENVMLIEVESKKTLLEILIEMGYESRLSLSVYDEKTLIILKNKNKLELAENVSESFLRKMASKVLKVTDAKENETLLEYMLDRGYNPLEKSFYIMDKKIIKILYQRKKIDLLVKMCSDDLFVKTENGSTYFEYILDCIKNKKIKVSVKKFLPTGNNINKIVDYYMIIAKHDMIDYIPEIKKDSLLKKYGDVMLLEKMLEVDSDLTVNKILTNSLKVDSQIAVILKSKGIKQDKVNVSSKNKNFADEYLKGVRNTLGVGPLYQEGEELLKQLEELFLSDGKSDKDLVATLISGYRQSLFVDYELHIQEIKKLILIKQQNLDKFFYLKVDEGSYFSRLNGSVCSDSLVVEILLHETGHALHYYLTDDYVPKNYYDVVLKVRNNPDTLMKVCEYAERYEDIQERISLLVKQKYKSFFESYYNEDKKRDIKELLERECSLKKEEFIKLGIPEEQLDIILSEMFTEEEFIEQQKRIFIKENVEAVLRSDFGSYMAICDILDAIYEGSLHSGMLKNLYGDKIKKTPGHGIAYYYDTGHGFDEMVANFAFISKSNDAIDKLELLKYLVGDELYSLLSEFYYQNISFEKDSNLESEKSFGGK